MNLYKYKVTRTNGHTFSRILTIQEIENGVAERWMHLNSIEERELERLPFVCDDKNGDKVFAGDKIAFNVDKLFGTNNRYEGNIYFCEKRLAYCVASLPAWDMPIRHNLKDIELIKEPDHDS